MEKEGEKFGERLLGNDLPEQERAYLEQARNSYRYFKFRGLPRVKAEGIEPPRLDKAFVSLTMQRIDALERRQSIAKGSPAAEELPAIQTPAEEIDLSAAMRSTSRLAIIGAAGSGKSTLLQWAGLACACARLGNLQSLSEEQKAFIQAFGNQKPPLPVLIPLRAFHEFCRESRRTPSNRSLLDFMVQHFSQRVSQIPLREDFFRKHLQSGCLLMFDGLDEVEPDGRPAVRAAVEDLLADYAGSPSLSCLITARYAAANVSDQMVGFRRCDVQRLLPEKRDELIHLWYRAVFPEDQAKAQSEAHRLCQRIAASDERVRELATTPLMVTIFAMVHYSRDELPRQRARLYEDAVEVLLTESHHEAADAPGLKQWGGVDWETQRDRLAWIAFELHQHDRESELENDLVDLIWSRYGSEETPARKAARQFLQYVAERGGLLEERGGRYGFYTHATFREYLAGRYLAEEYPPEQLAEFLTGRLADDRWEEAIRLAAGYLAIRGENQANRFIRLLASLGGSMDDRARALALAGMALADLRKDRQQGQTVEEFTSAALGLLEANPPGVAAPALRTRLGLALGAVGDPRLDPLNPAMISIPGGIFRMGTSPQDEERLKEQGAQPWDHEKPDHPVQLSAYAIGKYPLSNAEFRAFWEDRGYEQEVYWSQDGLRWLKGEWESDLTIYSENLREDVKSWLARRPVEKRRQPFFWEDYRWNAPNLPVVGICWFEAQAYCNWLSAKTGRRYRLLSEAEWERAARGEQGRLWPWGDIWEGDRCNTEEAPGPLNRTTPAGMYPHGGSIEGAQDLAGNVWEWCQDWYDPGLYGERANLQVVDPPGPAEGQARVVRGGSWYNSRNLARCASRYRFEPDFFDNDLGFRLALSPD